MSGHHPSPRGCLGRQAEIAEYEQEQGVEEQQRVAIIRDLHQRAEAQKASNEAWAKKVEESQEMANRLAKKVNTPITSEIRGAQVLSAPALV